MSVAERSTGAVTAPEGPCVTDSVTVASCSYCGEDVRLLDILVAVDGQAHDGEYAVWHLRCARERSLFDLAFPTS